MGRKLEIHPKTHCIHVTANIKWMQAQRDISTAQISERAGIGLSAFYKKMKKPETFTVRDIAKISNVLRCDMTELVEKRK